jgi:hypothetical protein
MPKWQYQQQRKGATLWTSERIFKGDISAALG